MASGSEKKVILPSRLIVAHKLKPIKYSTKNVLEEMESKVE